VVPAPPVAYGASGEHQAFAGTVSVGREALELLLLELGRSASATFTGAVFVSTHGGNAEPVGRAARRLQEEGRPTLVWSPQWGGDAHAGDTETAAMLALRPALVRMRAAAPGNTTPLDELWPALRRGGVRPVSPNGVLGNPTGATAAQGRRLLEVAAADLVLAVSGWAHGAEVSGGR
jgi:creatinine amidohydrolase